MCMTYHRCIIYSFLEMFYSSIKLVFLFGKITSVQYVSIWPPPLCLLLTHWNNLSIILFLKLQAPDGSWQAADDGRQIRLRAAIIPQLCVHLRHNSFSFMTNNWRPYYSCCAPEKILSLRFVQVFSYIRI